MYKVKYFSWHMVVCIQIKLNQKFLITALAKKILGNFTLNIIILVIQINFIEDKLFGINLQVKHKLLE
ncbi:transmembrane protein, putative (macronuclear) [Tetrahymena thermophila SB210]|uniref:Transmembrane protein, putative n=1 Tax=Tetrahymena thermophila (strain SB210) TaxID=312017 RepID=W7X9J9_TETTS|nr:transmembrane protein, putative [Tetrahymena thermophila SB210]EWS76090.1 transmembrane protein, putative [Tetrahymena thermophila SB210]|eukprot:XP_012651397.1 transmembrane protein, putative [Tetrahymena thermophila SB210]